MISAYTNIKTKVSKKSSLILFIIILQIIVWPFLGCNKLIEVPPPKSNINSDNVYTNDATAIAVLNSVFTFLHSTFSGQYGLSSLVGLSADELSLFNGPGQQDLEIYQYKNGLTANINWNYWGDIYRTIFTVNSALEGLNESTQLTPSIKQQLLAEAKFSRGVCYFYLTNLYGDVPLALTSDYKINAVLARSPQSQVYQQIISDLKDAQAMLSDDFLDVTLLKATAERVRPTKWAATALLARAYLYNKEWVNAVEQSTKVIEATGKFNLTGLDSTFLINNNEAIWQMQLPDMDQAAIKTVPDAKFFVLPPSGAGDNTPVWLSSFLLNAFEIGDQRKSHWISSVTTTTATYEFAYKYKNNDINSTSVSEYETLLRLGEQYLIRAEAQANGGGDINEAVNDLNTIRRRAGLPDYSGPIEKNSLLEAIMHERQTELFVEFGHRWFDLKRTNNVDAVMTLITPLKGGGTWKPTQALYPIPINDISYDVNLEQNEGY